MKGKALFLCLAAAATPVCANLSITKLLDDPEIVKCLPEGSDVEQMKNFYAFIFENGYNQLNEKYGDEITAQLENQIVQQSKKYLLSLYTGKEASAEEIIANAKAFVEHIQKKENIQDTEALYFLRASFNMAFSIAELELTKEKVLENFVKTNEQRAQFVLTLQQCDLLKGFNALEKESFPKLVEQETANA